MSAEEVQLSPTAELVMEVLAARTRLGELWWHFETRVGKALVELEDHGLISVQPGQAPKTRRASLTDLGRQRQLVPRYRPPIQQCRHGDLAYELREIAARIETV